MTVESATNKAGPYNVTGTSGTFARPFLILSAAHLRVIRVRGGVETDLTSGITHAGVGTADGAVTVTAGLQAGDVVYLLRDVPNLQQTDYTSQGRVRTDQVERDLDLATMQIQDLREASNRALTLPVSSELTGEQALDAAVRAPEFAGIAENAAGRAEAAAGRVQADYPSRAAMAELAAGLPAGQIVRADGLRYALDPTATGWRSALADLGVNGFSRLDGPDNAYLAAWFSDDGNSTIHFWTSADGISWNRLNNARLKAGDDGFFLQSRDPSMVFFRGEFWVSVTNYAAGQRDSLIFRSRDLITWSRHPITFGPSPVFSETVPLPGGIQPADIVWAPELVIDGDDLYAFPGIRFGNDVTDAFGLSVRSKMIFRSRLLDADAMTFSAPEYVPLGNLHPAGVYQAVEGQLAIPTNPLRHQTWQDGRMGLDVSFSQRFRTDFGTDDLLFIAAARGASGFANGQWRAGGLSYTTAVTRLQQFFAANPEAIMEAVIWDQGEADATNPTYQAELVDLFVRLRNAVPQLIGVPILMGLRAAWSPSATTINAVVTAAAAQIPDAFTVSAVGLNHSGDALHYDAPSIRVLGGRYYDAMVGARGGSGAGSTPQRRAVGILGQSNAVGQAPLDDNSGRAQIDAAAVRDGAVWYFLTKDEISKTIRIYQGDAIDGGFAFVRELTGPWKAEGVSAVPHLFRDPSGQMQRKWRVYTDAHADLDGVALGRQYFWEMAALNAVPAAPVPVIAGQPIRHGAVKNFGLDADPAAIRAIGDGAAFLGGDAPRGIQYAVQLAAGTRTIRPQPGVLYYVSGIAQVVNLTIKEGAADVFYLACLSSVAGTGINILPGAGGSFVALPLSLGFGMSSDRVLTMVRQPNGQYVPEMGGQRAAFVAHKNGTGQTITGTATTTVSMATAAANLGGFFSTGSSEWTPPAGYYRISGAVLVTGAAVGEVATLGIRRNGTLARQTSAVMAGGGSQSLHVDGLFYANGTDAFRLSLSFSEAGEKAVTGAETNTWFEGVPV